MSRPANAAELHWRSVIADELEEMEELCKDDPLLVDKMDAARGVRYSWGKYEPTKEQE